MKTLKFLCGLGFAFALAGCLGDRVKGFIPGTYVNSAGGEFSIASDTLNISLVEGNNYKINRHTGYNLIRNGKLGAREFEVEVWTCAYDPSTKILTELRRGKKITFYLGDNVLRVGARVYKKIQ
ncbi:MAG: hypothetical protein REI78_02805 [Pedobacter sp.]|nr:hypothetical protein [Pedobacter sp.]